MSHVTFQEYRYLWDLVSKKPFLTGFPLHLDVELTSRCNLRCEMCFQRHMEEKRADMREAVFRSIVDEGVEEGLCAMKLQSRGESLLHPRLIDYIAYAKDKGILDVHITTNGLLLNEQKIKGMVDCGLDLLIISFDRFHCESSGKDEREYREFFQDIVKRTNQYRIQMKSQMKIRIQTCIQDYVPENIKKEEEKGRELFPDADFILINPVYESYEEAPHLNDLNDYTFHPCSYLWQRLTIYADGSVTTCSRDYNCKYNRIGSLSANSIRELWHSPAMRDLRRRHLTGRRKDFHICALCENYLIHSKTGLPGVGCTGIVYELKG
jgi:radical SAM protein with 4Fe4S-binding SPASM domain